MKLTENQYLRIADCLPRQRGNVSMTNLELLNALLYVVEHGCKWRGLPEQFGNGVPTHLRSDNGPEFIAYAIQDWPRDKNVKTLYITLGSLLQKMRVLNLRQVHFGRR
jgi:transposase